MRQKWVQAVAVATLAAALVTLAAPASPASAGAGPYDPELQARYVKATSVELVFNNRLPDEDGFRLEMNLGGGWYDYATYPAGTTQTVIDGLSPHTPYCFNLIAYNESASGAHAICLTTPYAPL